MAPLAEFAADPGVQHLAELAILDDRMTPHHLRELCRSPMALSGLISLQLMGMNILDSGALMIALCPHLTELRRLELVRCQIGHRGAMVLTDEGRSLLKGLTWLDLSDNNLANDSLYALTSSPMIDRLERLHWNDNALTNSAPRLLADAQPPRLTHLELAGNHIGDIGTRVLLEHFPHLDYLDLSRNPLSRGMQVVLKEHYGPRVRLPGV